MSDDPTLRVVPDILLSRTTVGAGHDAALYFDDRVITFSQLSDRAASLSALSQERVPPAQRVAVLGANHPDWVAAYYGVSASGRQLCFLNHRLSPLELVEQMNRANVGLLFAREEEIDRIQPFLSELTTTPVFVAFDEVLPAASLADTVDQTMQPGAPTWLLFTSGTTGKPKGVLLSHDNVFASLRSAEHARFVGPEDIYAYPFPLCHVAGYNVPRLHRYGRPVVILEQFKPKSFLDNIEKHRVNSATVAATMLASLLFHLEANPNDRQRLQSLKDLSYGAAPMPAVLLRQAHDLLGVSFSQGFGMSELAGNALFLDADDHQRGFDHDPSLLSAAGSPGPGVSAKIIDEHGDELARGEPGELAIRGAQVMVGYLNDDQATEQAVEDGWLRTGDVGVLRPDGIFAIVDRLKDVIVTGGENVASLEVENAIRQACPELLDIAVVGISDPTWGENVCACVVLRPQQTISLDEIALRLHDSLAPYKIPRHLVVLDALPQTHSGKTAKADLRSWLANDPLRAGERRGSVK
jgi:acyl-CoA synthetase (AMP-forming)/AMP-acid ligase II